MALYIFSDAHLGSFDVSAEEIKKEKIDKLLAIVKSDGDRLVILGDLFEFWFEYKNAMPKEHFDILSKLYQLKQQGVIIDYVSGNHDFWMDDFFEKQMGINVYLDSFELQYENQKIYFTHGDGLAKGDRGYRLLKRILRNRLNIWLYRKLPPDWAIPLAKSVAGGSRNHTSGRCDTFSKDYEDYAKAKLADGYDIVAIGHLHKPLRIESENGIYVNSGDFINHFSYIKITNEDVTLNYIE